MLDSPDSACPLHLRPIVVSSPNCSARDRRLCLRCNLAFWALPAQTRRRPPAPPLVQTLTSRLDPRAQPAPPAATATATAYHSSRTGSTHSGTSGRPRTYADLCTDRSNQLTRPFPWLLPSLSIGLLLLRGLAVSLTCPPSTKLDRSWQLTFAVD